MWLLLHATVLSLTCVPLVAQGAVCSVGDGCQASGSKQESYFWPTAHGHWKHYSRSPYVGPFNLSAAEKWSWHHPEGEFHDMYLGAAIDDRKNVYVAGDQHTYKLSPDGQLIWTYTAPLIPGEDKRRGNFHPNAPALYDGAVYLNSVDGRFYALDMDTGKEIWVKRVAASCCCDTGHMAAYAGYVIVHTDATEGSCGRCQTVRALNASDGSTIWTYKPDNAVWDLMVDFVGDGTIVFQDLTGKGYRNYLANGTNIWKAGGYQFSWTDGTQALGPNDMVYTVNANGCQGPGCPGRVTAHRLADGEVVWQRTVPEPPNVSPAVGELREGEGLSVVVPASTLNDCDPAAAHFFRVYPILMWLPDSLKLPVGMALQKLAVWAGDGQQWLLNLPDQPFDVYAFNAETGDLRWKWTGPVYKRVQTVGDEKGFTDRASREVRAASCPALPAPRIGGDGTVYVQHKSGYFFAIRDFNGDGKIDDDKEVSSFDCEHDFSSVGSAHAPGLIVAASGGKVWGFKS